MTPSGETVMSGASATGTHKVLPPGEEGDGVRETLLEDSADQIRAVLDGQRELSRILKELKEGTP